ncbi:MAG: glycosyltransferase family 61 protein [Synergistaceae bacterium]|jgi:hypothetical protein|nr:glycosyltransferase family 61 protein [Synergistaceae bacterium]
MPSYRYLWRAVKDKFRKNRGVHFHDIAYIECTEEMVFLKEKFSLPDYLDIEGKSHRFFEGYDTTIPPFYVRSIKNGLCYTSGEEVYTSDGQVIVDHTRPPQIPPVRWRRFLKNVTYVKGKVAHLGLMGLENNYYHWLIDCLGCLSLLIKSHFYPDFYILSNTLSFQKQWLKLLGIKEEQIIPANQFIQAEEIIVFDFINNWRLVDFRGYRHYQRQWLPHWITDIYKNIVPYTTRQKKKKNIYISRQNAPYRAILNEKDLFSLLDKYNFTVVYLENLPVEKQIEVFVNAKTVVGIHGAGLTNSIFSDPGTPVLEINTQYYHDSSYRVLLSQTGHIYHYLIGETYNTSVPPKEENVYIEPERFDSALKTVSTL